MLLAISFTFFYEIIVAGINPGLHEMHISRFTISLLATITCCSFGWCSLYTQHFPNQAALAALDQASERE
jgi:hypothetical protein